LEINAERLSQPKTYNIFSPDYEVAECYGCGEVLGIDLLRRYKRHLYCYFCLGRLENELKGKLEKREERNRNIERIKKNPELSLRQLGRINGMSHEAVRLIRLELRRKNDTGG